MSTIDELYEAFSQVNLRENLPAMVQQTSFEITALIIEQKEQGLNGLNEKITPLYKNAAYAKKKYWQYNPLAGYGTPDGRLTGAYDTGLNVSIAGDEYTIDSNVPYADADSLTQYGPEFIMMNDENTTLYCEETLAPVIQDYITEKTGLIFE